MARPTRPESGAPTASAIGVPSPSGKLTSVLGSRRAILALATIVFVTTAIQVLMKPTVGILSESFTWNHPLPLGTVAALAGIITALQSASLLMAPRLPQAAVLATVAFYLAMILLGVPNWASGMPFVVAVAMFLLTSRSSWRASAAWLVLVTVLALGGLLAWALSTGSPTGVLLAWGTSEGVAFIAPVAGAAALGTWWGIRSRGVERAQAEIAAAARAQEERIAQARTQERLTIAQELHDVAGQHLAGLLSLADAAIEVDVRDPDRALALIEDMRLEGRYASASLYAALRDLRAVGEEHVAHTPDLAQVSDLIDYWRRRGMRVDARIGDDLDDLPAMVSTSAYRGIQESLTNAAKHAPGASVRVSVAKEDQHLYVRVENAAADGRAPAQGVGLGWGLDGLRERIRLLTGTVEAGPAPGGGWSVELVIPVLEVETHAATAR